MQDTSQVKNFVENLDKAMRRVLTRKTWTPEAYDLMIKSGSISRPELLYKSAEECFLYEQDKSDENLIRKALIHLRFYGILPQN